ncbi:flagellar hook-basal body protein [Clostridium sp. WILCCON 0269]|uniref:Flagellar hook protein FlgE n=1 Tax=Candidatus Clostridium eludens TaxID=3381663 RepID=A0ABW8SI74_9CLOT
MLPSLYSGISGLRANQQKLNIIGNNIANSSTTGFKTQSMNFQDMISQNLSDPSAPSNSIGGVNGKQSGLGVKIGGISTDFTTGSMETTNRNLDFAIDGTGYFVVGTGALGTDSTTTGVGIDTSDNILNGSGATAPTDTVTPYYTRDGAFSLDEYGNLVTADGHRVMGYQVTDGTNAATITYNKSSQNTIAFADGSGTVTAVTGQLVPLSIPDSVTKSTGEVKVKTFSVGSDGYITAQLADGTTAALGQIAMVSFQNESGLLKQGSNLYTASSNSGQPIVRTGKGDTTIADNSGGYGDMSQGMLEMSNVDLAQQFTDMIIASRAFQANGKIITTDDDILQDLINLKR